MNQVDSHTMICSLQSKAMRGCVAGLVLLCFGLGWTGCGVRTAPVSSTLEKNTAKDSLVTKSETRKDSSSYIEKTTSKVLPGGTVGVTLTKEQMDSLIHALQAMPSSVPRTIYRSDARMQATLEILMDSIGALHFKCTSADQLCAQTQVIQTRYIEKMKEESQKVTLENAILKEQILQLQKSPWERIRASLNNLVIWIVAGIFALGVLAMIFSYIKSKIKIL